MCAILCGMQCVVYDITGYCCCFGVSLLQPAHSLLIARYGLAILCYAPLCSIDLISNNNLVVLIMFRKLLLKDAHIRTYVIITSNTSFSSLAL